MFSFLRKKKHIEEPASLNELILTELYGKTAVEYAFSEEYEKLQKNQSAFDDEYINKTALDENNADARDGFYDAVSELEKAKAEAQEAAHLHVNREIEQLSKRELVMQVVLNEMREANERFLKEEL